MGDCVLDVTELSISYHEVSGELTWKSELRSPQRWTIELCGEQEKEEDVRAFQTLSSRSFQEPLLRWDVLVQLHLVMFLQEYTLNCPHFLPLHQIFCSGNTWGGRGCCGEQWAESPFTCLPMKRSQDLAPSKFGAWCNFQAASCNKDRYSPHIVSAHTYWAPTQYCPCWCDITT